MAVILVSSCSWHSPLHDCTDGWSLISTIIDIRYVFHIKFSSRYIDDYQITAKCSIFVLRYATLSNCSEIKINIPLLFLLFFVSVDCVVHQLHHRQTFHFASSLVFPHCSSLFLRHCCQFSLQLQSLCGVV